MKNMKFEVLVLLFIAIAVSCNTSKNPLFGKRTPREKYADNLKEAGLEETQLSKLWTAAGEKSLNQPRSVNIPFKETGYLAAERPSATGYRFSVQRGENVLINLSTIPSGGVLYFAELWQLNGTKSSLLTAMDTLNKQLKYTVNKDAEYLFRIQPELLKSLEYTVAITTGPSLAFPVDSLGNPRFISFWGASRDAGDRKHEEVDIKANFHTPALAAADGIVRTGNNDLGGKVVFIYEPSTGNSFYYAHLDSQIAHDGQHVFRGEVVGLVGKTGNAINTAPHLHFGIYTGHGAINSLLFINPKILSPTPVKASIEQLNKWLRATSDGNVYEGPSEKSGKEITTETGDAILVLGASADWYRVQFAGGVEGYIKERLTTNRKLRSETVKAATRLLDSPSVKAPATSLVPGGTVVKVIGKYNNYYLVRNGEITGWIDQ